MEKERKLLQEDKKERKVRFIVINIIRLLLVISFISAFINGRQLIMLISSIAMFVTFIPYIFKEFLDIELPAHFEVIVILFIYGTMLFGEVHGFYAEFWWWSVLINFSSAIALGLVGLAVIYSLHKGERIHATPLIMSFFSFCFALAIGTLWELFEFSIDKFFMFNLHKGDPMIDLSVNLFGAILVSTAGYYYIRNGKLVIISGLVSRFVERNPKIFGNLKMEDYSKEILKLINEGESKKVEFKSSLRTNLHTKQVDKRMEHAVLKTITAYLNSEGGTLLIGVSDGGEICGIEHDDFPSADKASLHVISIIKDNIGGEFLPHIKSNVVNINGKNVLRIDCERSHKEVFLKNGNEEKFYVRSGSSSVELNGSSLVDYVHQLFRKGIHD